MITSRDASGIGRMASGRVPSIARTAGALLEVVGQRDIDQRGRAHPGQHAADVGGLEAATEIGDVACPSSEPDGPSDLTT